MATGWRNWPLGEEGFDRQKGLLALILRGEQSLQQAGGCVLTAQQMQSLKIRYSRARELEKPTQTKVMKRQGIC